MASKRQLLLELLASDKTGPATKGAAENLDTVATSAEEAAKATDHLGTQAEESKQEVERFGKSNKSAAEHSEALKLEIESLERELKKLAIEFAEAETAADRADFSKAIRKAQSDLRNLNKSKSLVEELIPGADPAPIQTAAKNIDQLKEHIKGLKTAFLAAGTVEGRSFLSKAIKDAEGELQDLEKISGDVAKGLKGQFSDAFSGLGEIAGPALGIAAAAAAPAIAAAISGAVVGGVGVGGIVGGLLLVSKNPQVSSALDALKKETGDRLKDAAAPFVPVALDGIRQIDGALKDIDFKGLFSDAAKEAGPLIHGVAVAVEGLGHGITDLIHNAGPAVAEIGHGIGELGQTIGDGLAELSSNGKEGADALHNIFTIVDVGIQSVFGLLDVLTKTYGVLRKFAGNGVVDALDAIANFDKPMGTLTKATTDQASAASNGAAANRNWAKAADVAAEAAQGQRSALSQLANQLHAQVDPAFAVIDAQDKLAQAQKASTAAIKKYGDTSSQARTANRNLALAALDLTDAVGKAGGSLNGKITPALRNTLKAAGLADDEIASVAASFRQAKKDGDAFAKKYTATIHVAVDGPERLDPSGHRLGGYRADGGPVRKGKAYVVGERRPEVFVPDRDGTIIPSIDQFGGGSHGSGGGVVEHRLILDASGADTEMGRLILKLLRTQTGFASTVRKYVTG